MSSLSNQNLVFASVLYEQAQQYLADFVAGVCNAFERHPARIVLVSDSLKDPHGYFGNMPANLSVEIKEINSKGHPVKSREILFNVLRSLSADIFIFSDCDDVLTSDAVKHHLMTLKENDFSYSDQLLMDETGKLTGRSLYDSWHVPDRLDSIEPILMGNFVGASGLAFRACCLCDIPTSFPKQLRAVDWWLVTRMLLAGHVGAKTSKPTVCYRQHQNNTTIQEGALSYSEFLKRMEIVKLHLREFKQYSEFTEVYDQVLRLETMIADRPEDVRRTKAFGHCNGPWYSDIFKVIEELGL